MSLNILYSGVRISYPARNVIMRRSNARYQNAVSRALEVIRVLLRPLGLHPVHPVQEEVAALVIEVSHDNFFLI